MKKSTLNLTPERFLDQLSVGESGFVGQISPLAAPSDNGSTAPPLERRLMEIGFIPGEPLQVLHKGFFGGEPIAVRIGQSTFALRRFEAALIPVLSQHEK